MFVLDANILIDAVNSDSPFHRRSAAIVDEAGRGSGAWFLTWGVCYEFLRVATHRRVFRAPLRPSQAWNFVETLIAAPSLTMLVATERHPAVVAEVLRIVPDIAGNFWHDTTTAVLMREHGVRRIYTRDTGFHRFPFIEPIDPTA